MLGRVSEFVLEVLPWALASLIAAFLLAGHVAARPVGNQVKPGSTVGVPIATTSFPVR